MNTKKRFPKRKRHRRLSPLQSTFWRAARLLISNYNPESMQKTSIEELPPLLLNFVAEWKTLSEDAVEEVLALPGRTPFFVAMQTSRIIWHENKKCVDSSADQWSKKFRPRGLEKLAMREAMRDNNKILEAFVKIAQVDHNLIADDNEEIENRAILDEIQPMINSSSIYNQVCVSSMRIAIQAASSSKELVLRTTEQLIESLDLNEANPEWAGLDPDLVALRKAILTSQDVQNLLLLTENKNPAFKKRFTLARIRQIR